MGYTVYYSYIRYFNTLLLKKVQWKADGTLFSLLSLSFEVPEITMCVIMCVYHFYAVINVE